MFNDNYDNISDILTDLYTIQSIKDKLIPNTTIDEFQIFDEFKDLIQLQESFAEPDTLISVLSNDNIEEIYTKIVTEESYTTEINNFNIDKDSLATNSLNIYILLNGTFIIDQCPSNEIEIDSPALIINDDLTKDYICSVGYDDEFLGPFPPIIWTFNRTLSPTVDSRLSIGDTISTNNFSTSTSGLNDLSNVFNNSILISDFSYSDDSDDSDFIKIKGCMKINMKGILFDYESESSESNNSFCTQVGDNNLPVHSISFFIKSSTIFDEGQCDENRHLIFYENETLPTSITQGSGSLNINGVRGQFKLLEINNNNSKIGPRCGNTGKLQIGKPRNTYFKPDNEWSHICFTFDNSQNARFYINGEKIIEKILNNSNDGLLGLEYLYIGSVPETTNKYCSISSRTLETFLDSTDVANSEEFYLKHLAIYDWALSEDEIFQLSLSSENMTSYDSNVHTIDKLKKFGNASTEPTWRYEKR